MSDLNLRIITKGSSTAGEVPGVSDLEVGELAINTADKALFTKHSDNTIVTIASGGGGGAENLGELLDVDLTTPATDGQGIAYDSTSSTWKPSDLTASVNGQTGVVTLGIYDLNDFQISPNKTYTRDKVASGSTISGTGGDYREFDNGGTYTFEISHGSPESTTDYPLLASGETLYASADNGATWYAFEVSTVSIIGISGFNAQRYGVVDATAWQALSLADGTTVLFATSLAPTADDSIVWDGSLEKFTTASRVASVNGETGVVSLGIQEMDDYSPAINSFTDLQRSGTWSNWMDAHASPYVFPTAQGEWRAYQKNSLPGEAAIHVSSLDDNGDSSEDWTSLTLTNLKMQIIVDGTVYGPVPVSSITDGSTFGVIIEWDVNDLNPSDYDWGYYIDTPNRAPTSPRPYKPFTIRLGYTAASPVEAPLADGDTLQWSKVMQKFQPAQLNLVDALDDLSDVDVTTTPPTDGQVLKWNNATSQWEAGNALGTGSLVNSVNTQTGDVVIGIQDLDDYQPQGAPSTGYDWQYETGGLDTQGEWEYAEVSGHSRLILTITDINGADTSGQFSAGQTIWCQANGGAAVSYAINTVSTTTVGGQAVYYLDESTINNLGVVSFSSGDTLVITLLEPGSALPLVDGDILSWNDVDQKFEPGQLNLDGLADVDSSGVIGEQPVIWDEVNAEWVAGYPLLSDPAGVDGTRDGRKINELADVSRTAPTDGQVLMYDNPSSSYVPTNLVDSLSLATTDLTDVALSIDPATIGSHAWDAFSATATPSNGEWATSLLRWSATPSRGATWSTSGSTTFWATTNGLDWYEETANIQYFASGDYYYIQTSEITLLHQRMIDEDWEVLYLSLTAPPESPTTVPYADNDFLKYDSTSQKFLPTQVSSVALSGDYNDLLNLPSGTTLSIDDLTDVDTTTVAPTDGQTLLWDSANGEWKPGAAATVDVATIDDLGDVDTTTSLPQNGQTLTWDYSQSKWVPSDANNGLGGHVQTNVTTDVGGVAITQDLGQLSALISIESDVAAWVCIYSSTEAMIGDTNRSILVDPDPGSGILAEFYLEDPNNLGSGSRVEVSPSISIFNGDNPITDNIYIKTRNQAGNNVSASLTIETYITVIGASPVASGGGAGTGPTRETRGATETYASFADGESKQVDIPSMGGSGMFRKVRLNFAGMLTFYADQASYDADTGRASDTSPGTSSGVMLEVITTGDEEILVSPSVMYFNDEGDKDMVMRITNLSGADQTSVTWGVDFVRYET